MNRDEMVDALQQLGFQRQSTVSGKWRGAFFKSNGEKSMLVLVRTRGVDVLVSTLTREEMTTPEGLLRVFHHFIERFDFSKEPGSRALISTKAYF